MDQWREGSGWRVHDLQSMLGLMLHVGQSAEG